MIREYNILFVAKSAIQAVTTMWSFRGPHIVDIITVVAVIKNT